MIKLTTNLSAPLTELLQDDPVLVDGLEIGPWLSLEELRAARQQLPDMPFTFHGGNLLLQVGSPGILQRARDYVEATASPWASMHLFIWPYWMARILYRVSIPLPRPDPRQQVARLIRQVHQLQAALPVPVTLENIEFVPSRKFIDHIQPALIRHVLDETGCALLLDLGHARVAAAELDIPARDYLLQLPLERVIQIHISGPRIKNGRLFDAHQTLQDEDYDLLQFALQHTRPQVLTLEYIREKAALRQQLAQLRQLITP